ncbi:hypothetical protein AALB16_10800 [Lachnospiraceae bacterium 62-35]
METITALTTLNYSSIFAAIFTILVGLKAVVSVFEWIMDKFGLETRGMRNRREEHDLLAQTSQSLTELQKELRDSIKDINENGLERDKRIEALALGNKEVLANIINERYQKYLRLEGIPADEIDEFTNIHDAYKSLGGNHNGDIKYAYVMKHLPVIPVETKLITKPSCAKPEHRHE